ncbi:hypothetical protein NQ318_008788 [Aromia moschata]|uniref:Uncharacterized protein n=1 Tax=Aromia moschata TaxID=1265417 RepID=A0AAV8ZAZ0_9CUCU|nr:hypothetical protein NQ318_008788 [Aromia moschata]
MGQIEKEGEEKLKNWQNRKLLELQTQYREALRELGTGHKDAAELEGEDEVLAEQREYNKGIAKHRSQVAATQIQLEKERRQMKKTIPIQQRKVARDIENTRSSLVSNIKKKKNGASGSIGKITKKRKSSADINITLQESNSESREDEDEDTEYDEEEEKSSCECTEDSQEHPWKPLDINTNLDSKCTYQEIPDVSPEPDMGRSSKIPEEITKFTENIRQETTGGCKQPPKDTRISDRIKRRDIMASQPDYCDIAAEIHPTPLVASNTRIRDAIDSRYFGKPDSGTGLKDGRYSTEDIPTKPPVKLKDTDGQQLRDTYDSQKMEYYDHPNRFSQEKVVPSSSFVEKNNH